ncbi:probable splicing factor 3B subunit 3 isoform X1 [Citrus clementina]|uniref:probable splicing factor 3B subunit 3 isoform X1 n=1 Tax=Citrus clementina TaxID=85681 RepID=UPI000CED60C5|nr:probable splicing factor 3B subunit 3 isoform X1 [Citrus x clementina]
MAVSEEVCSTAKSRSSPSSSSAPAPPPRNIHYLAKCVLKGSVVLQVAHGHLRSPTSNDVVFGKETSIELVIIGEDGIVQSVCEQAVFGTIKDLAVVPWNDKFNAQNSQVMGKDLLVVISDSGKLSFLAFCNEMHRFFPVAQVHLSNPGNSRHQLGRMLAVDSSGCFIAVSAYEDRLGLFSLSMSSGSDIIDKKICYPSESEVDTSASRIAQKNRISGTIWSMCFISTDPRQPSKEHNPILAIILNRRGALLNELLLVGWNIREHAISVLSCFFEAGPLAHSVVEVPRSYGFAFVFRIGDALLMDLRDPHNPSCVYRTSLNFLPPALEEQNFVDESCRVHDVDDEGLFNVAACALLELRDYDPMCIDSDSGNAKEPSKHVCSWSWEPETDKIPKMVFCVDTGEFFMIEIAFGSDGLKVHLSECLYKGPPCKAILWVEGRFLSAFVEMGDGMVLKEENGRLVYTSPIQNIAPILDMSVVDYHDEKRDQMFACCGVAPEGSLRIIRSGISLEKLLRTAPIYQGITGTWTVRMKVSDPYHSFLVLSFVEETRVLRVGLNFTDVTDSVGFRPDVCTLACGLVADGLLVQIHQNAVRLCIPTMVAHSGGIPLSYPVCTSWFPEHVSISLGAVAHNMIIVSTSNPCFLFILGVRSLSVSHYEIYEMQHMRLQSELSCISIPQKHPERRKSSSPISLVSNSSVPTLPAGVIIGYTFVIGTHRPSVEVLSFVPKEGLRVLASGSIVLTNTMGTAISGCIPQDVRLVLADQFYVLAGLRNGMLLRFEWPPDSNIPSSVVPIHSPISATFRSTENIRSGIAATSSFGSEMSAFNLTEESKDELPINLQLIATRHIGITPVFLVPLSDSLDADMIALSDRPWLLQTARHSLAYTSISFQPSTHATPVCSVECPKGILFVAENSLNLVEMVHNKRLNVRKFHLGGTPKKVLYHSESRLLIVMRTELNNDTCSSDICCVDPLSGSVLSSFKLELGETGKSMELVRVGHEQVLVVGTSLSSGPAIMPSGEAESTKGRLIVLCIEHMQNSDCGSMTFCSKAGSSSQRTSPFREIVGYATEQLSSSSLCSSPDDASCDGIKLEETETWQLRLAYSTTWPGMVLAICPYLDRYFLASAGNAFYVCGFPNDNPQRVRRFAVGRTRFMIMLLTAHFTRIAVGDCRDGILFYSYHEDARKLEQIYCDPSQRLVADCVLMDVDTAVVSDRKGSIAVLSCSDRLEDNASPECNLTLNCAYHMGEIAVSIRKGSFIYKLPADDALGDCLASFESSQTTIIASTLLGSIVIFIPISSEEYELLEAVQARLAIHPLTAPLLGNDHSEFRSRENPVGVPKILDGDMLSQFLELTSTQQEAVLSFTLGSFDTIKASSKLPPSSPIPVNQVVQLLERVHYALN